MEPNSTQYKWLVDELSSTDRSETPWLLVSIHVPIYNTFALHKHDKQIVAAREHLEPLFMDYSVNMVFTGHIHAYQRTANVYREQINPKGPIHVTIGAGGRDCEAPYKTEEPEDWIISRDATFYGYGLFSIHNRTHAEWTWIPLSPSGTSLLLCFWSELSATSFDSPLVLLHTFFLRHTQVQFCKET